jgi:amino acid transporter
MAALAVCGALTRYRSTQARLFGVLLGHRAAIAVMCLLVLVLNFQSLAILQASSRYLWALSRDKSIPFSSFFYRVSKDKLPVAATWLLVVLATPMVAVLWTYPEIVPAVLYSASGIFWAFVFVGRAGGMRWWWDRRLADLCSCDQSVPPLLTVLARVDLAQEDRSNWSLRRMR